MHFCNNGLEALEYLRSTNVDVMVTDITMPFMSGLELLQRVKDEQIADPPEVILVTGLSELDLKRQALDLGATDLLTKPVRLEEMEARIRSGLRIKQYHRELQSLNAKLEQRVNERTRQLQSARLELILRLAKAAELRDEQTGSHILRVAQCARKLAICMGLSNEFADTILFAAPLHDIGKIGIPDSILLKPGRLTASERQIMQLHCDVGARILSDTDELTHEFRKFDHIADLMSVTESDPILVMARQIAQYHHEWWNGGGYPQRLSGEDIPLAARIVAVADVFDALISERPYKQACTTSFAVAELISLSGVQFDPQVIETFLEHFDRHSLASQTRGSQQEVYCG